MTDLADVEERLRAILSSLPQADRAYLLDLLTRGGGERAAEIGALYRIARFRGVAELLIDLEEEPAARAFVAGMLREVST